MKTQKRTGGTPPMLPRRPTTGADPEALVRLRRFHLSGPSTEGPREPLPDLLPALLHQFGEPERVRTDYPLYLPPPTGDEGEALCLSLPDFLRGAVPAPDAMRILVDNLPRLERAVREAIVKSDRPQAARALLAEGAKAMLAELKLGPEDRVRVEADVKAFLDGVPEGGRFLPISEQAPLYLIEQAARSRVLPRRAKLAREAALLAEKVRGMVDYDRRTRAESSDPGALRESMGKGGDLLDPAALAGVIGPRRGASSLREDRRERLEGILAVLRNAADTLGKTLLTLVHDGALGPLEPGDFPGIRVVTDDDPCAAAECLFDEQAEEMAQILRAIRSARLELEGRFDPARHEPWLREFTWEAFSRDEFRLLLPVTALERDDQLTRRPMQSLSRLLLSGRPVQVLVVTQPAHNPGADPDDPLAVGFRLEPGYLGLSHREAMVQQTSAARPAHMLEGFLRGLGATRTALHVIATGLRADGLEPKVGSWLYAGAALEGRAHPFFHYDPESGRSWARRFDVAGNPQPDEDWPLYTLAARREGAAEEVLDLRFTFADFAMLEPGLSGHFRVIPEEVPETDLLSVPEYLELDPEDAAGKIPFVWGVDAASTLRRVAVSRRLALAARDRLGYWRTLQEMAGVRSDYVSEAVERVRAEVAAQLEAEKARLEEEADRKIERARREANEDVVNRLTAALLDIDLGALPAPGGSLGGFRGRNVDQVAAELMQLVDPATLDETAAPSGDERVESMANELMKLIDPEDLG